MNPIIGRELIEVLRTRRALALQAALAVACMLLVLVRWPTGDIADLSGARSLQVMRIFGYGLLVGILLMAPAFPAASLVREKNQGTLALLLNTPMSPLSIYLGKLGGALGVTAVLIVMTMPAAAACYVLGGTGVRGGIGLLYALLGVAALQISTLGLLVSCRSQSTDGALRVTYALVLTLGVLTLVPEALLRGSDDLWKSLANWLRCLSPIPGVMEILGQSDVGSHGMSTGQGAIPRYLLLAGLSSLACAAATVMQLRHTLLDRARSAGVMTEDRSEQGRIFRRLLFLIDPQRRSGNMSLWINPVMVKEFRSRRFGRSHWMIRLVAISAILSLVVSLIASVGVEGWSIEIIGGGMVLLQIAILILFAPSLASGLVSSERESGAWQLLRMTPLRPGAILRGKLTSVAWPLLLLLCATLPGYVIMMTVKPTLVFQVQRVVVCLSLTAIFAVLLSAAVSTLFRSTAMATTVSYLALLAVCAVPLLVWLGRDAPFGHATVEAVLKFNPVAAALQASDTAGFRQYELLPFNWWVVGSACVALVIFLGVRTWQLCRPE